MSNIIVISQPWGGLGDNLQYSTLPKLYHEKGYKVYISSKNKYRNNEVRDFVWGLNPYIEGVSDLPENAGACKGFHRPTDNPMKNMELSHGLTNGTDKYPVIYYTPKLIKELENCILYDTTSISSSYSDEYIEKNFTTIFNKYPTLEKRKVVFSNIANRETPYFKTDTYMINSLYEYCDAIASCKVHISVCSGSVVLASAIKQYKSSPEIYCFHRHKINSTGYMYFFDNTNMIYCP